MIHPQRLEEEHWNICSRSGKYICENINRGIYHMQFDEYGNVEGKTLMLLPGTACDYQTNFGSVLERLGERYHLICVNYDGFDGSRSVFEGMITVTEKIETYIEEHFDGRIDGRSALLLEAVLSDS